MLKKLILLLMMSIFIPGVTGLMYSPGGGSGETEEQKKARLEKEAKEKEELEKKKKEEEEKAKLKKLEEEKIAKLKEEEKKKKEELEKKKAKELQDIKDIEELKIFFSSTVNSLKEELELTKKQAKENAERYKQKERENIISNLTDADKQILKNNDYDISKMDTETLKLAKTLLASKKKMLGNEGNPGFNGTEKPEDRLKRLGLI